MAALGWNGDASIRTNRKSGEATVGRRKKALLRWLEDLVLPRGKQISGADGRLACPGGDVQNVQSAAADNCGVVHGTQQETGIGVGLHHDSSARAARTMFGRTLLPKIRRRRAP
jgi:hypothetical protein